MEKTSCYNICGMMGIQLNRVCEITVVTILTAFFCICLPVQESDAFRQVQPPMILPHPAPPQGAAYDTGFEKWSGMEVISAMKKNGLEAVVNKGLTVGAPSAKETTLFLIPSAGENIGGLAASYQTEKALEGDMKYYSGMNKPDAPPAWRIYRRDNILLLISGKVPQEQSLRYKEVLEGM